ncbi:MAG: L,D-transpeptidase [Thermoanaerobaculia bacterium]
MPLSAADVEIVPWESSVERTLELEIEGLPPLAPLEGTVITVDTTKSRIYLFKDGELVREDLAATGMDKLMRKGSRVWLFRTPRGRMEVLRKIVDPVWTKPDWAFVEEGRKVPPAGSPSRKVRGVLGKYALDLGDRILIHGTKDLDSLGKKASHGCIRVGAEMLELIYREASVGTPVIVF